MIYDIALSFNEKFVPGALVAMASLAANSLPSSTLRFHLFTDGVRDASLQRIREVVERVHSDTKVLNYPCDEKLLKDLPSWAGTRMASVRIHFPALLQDVKWCLYLDCDIVFLAPVEELFALRNDSKYAVVVRDEGDEFCCKETQRIKTRCGVEISRDLYFNSGVVLFNFEKCRQDAIPSKVMEFFACNSDSQLPDQTALNVVFNSQTSLAPGKFNRLLPFLDSAKVCERPVLHYISGKPWTCNYGEVANSRYLFWHACADKYVYGGMGGMSERSLFRWRVRAVKRLLFLMLAMPGIGCALSWLMNVMHITGGDRQGWRRIQYIPSMETGPFKRSLWSLLEDGKC